MPEKEKAKPSLAGLYRGIILVMIPLLLLVIGLSFGIRRAISRQVLDSAHAGIENQLAGMDAACYNINRSILNLLTGDGDVRTLQESDDPYLKNLANLNLQTKFRELRDNFLGNYHYFYYGKEEETMIMPTPAKMDYETSKRIRNRILLYLETDSEELQASNRKWKLLQADGGSRFLVKIYHSDDSYLGCWISLDSVFRDFGVNEYGSVKQYMMVVENGRVVTGRSRYEEIAGTDQLLVNSADRFKIRGSYEIAWYEFDKGDFAFLFLTNILEQYQSVQNFLVFLVGLLLAILGSGVGMLIYIKRKLLRPVNNFIRNLSLEDVEKGRPPYFAELSQVDRLFRNARKQIEELKIGMYEKELDRQRMELDYLQLQIRPHFYLNCLNLIYGMAQSGHTAEIQKLSLEVSGYLRSVFRQGGRPVSLGEELEHVEKYLSINAIRYENEFEREIVIPEELKECRIAPLLIQTLVENSVKHAMLSQQVLKIRVTADLAAEKREEQNEQKEQNEGFLHIQVEDNGSGFPAEVLEVLNGGGSLATEDGRRVGLANTIRRLTYFYHGEARIRFSNRPEGGARTELWIPEGTKEEP